MLRREWTATRGGYEVHVATLAANAPVEDTYCIDPEERLYGIFDGCD
jgi:hypothetical protein